MWAEFLQLFTEMGWVSATLISVGIVFCIVEMFVPGVGFFGITGSICVFGGIVARAVEGAPLNQIILLILLSMGGLWLALTIIILCIKSGLFSKGIVNSATTLGTDYGKIPKEMLSLKGKQGLAITELKPIGKIQIGDKTLEVMSTEGIIPKNTRVIVNEIQGDRIFVSTYKGVK